MAKSFDGRLLPRDQGGSITLTEGTGGLLAMCPCGDFLEIYKEDTTFRLQTPEGVDPNRTNPDAPTVAMVADRIGCANPIVARVLLQAREILERALFEKPVDKDAVVQILHSIKESLVACYKAAASVGRSVDDIVTRAENAGIPIDAARRVIPSLPQVPDLDEEVTRFLVAAKRAIKAICSLAPQFIELDGEDSNLDHLAARVERCVEEGAPLKEFLQAYADVSKYLIELRNCQEHPKKTRRTHVNNFRVLPHGQIAAPMWYVTGETPQPIRAEMDAAIDRLVEMAEGMLIHLVMERIGERIPLVIRELPPAEIDRRKPIKYELTLLLADMQFATPPNDPEPLAE